VGRGEKRKHPEPPGVNAACPDPVGAGDVAETRGEFVAVMDPTPSISAKIRNRLVVFVSDGAATLVADLRDPKGKRDDTG
jgi:hypothetical protein